MIHLYGFVIGIAIVVGLWLMEIQAKKHQGEEGEWRSQRSQPGLWQSQRRCPGVQISSDNFYKLSWVILLGGIIGARFYHVATDFHLYQNQLLDIFKVWQGGMSIIGGVMGGVLSAWVFLKFSSLGKKINLATILDLSVFGLPVAQAIGRWGNFFNQELYGMPTQLPWKIYIEPINRLIGYENFSYFQPLFFYEMILMLLFAGVVWVSDYRQSLSGFSIGSGKLFSLYVFYYSFIRFCLDFIRIDKTQFLNTILGFNQVFLIMVMIITASFWLKKKQWKK